MSTQQDRAFEDLRNTLGEYSRILLYRWRLVVVGLGLVGSLGFWYSQFLPRQYRAATIFERRDDVVLRNLIQTNSPYSFDSLKSSIVLDMTGTRALANAAVELGMIPKGEIAPSGALSNEELKKLDRVTGRYGVNASVRLMQSSPALDTIQLTVDANDPLIARKFAVVLRDRYMRDTRDRITEILESARNFFDDELDEYRGKVAASDAELTAMFADFPGVDPTDLASAGARLTDLQQKRDQLTQRQSEIEADIAAREEFLKNAPTPEVESADGVAGMPDSAVTVREAETSLRKSIAEVEGRISEALTVGRKTAEHPDVRALYRKLDGLYAARETLGEVAAQQTVPPADGRPRLGGAAFNQWQAQKIVVELELNALRQQLSIVEERLAEARQRAARFDSLYQRLLAQGDDYAALARQMDEDATTVAAWRQHLTQLNRVLTAEVEQRGTTFSLVEDTKDVSRAASPRVASVFAASAGFGLAAAALLVALAELLDRSFRSAGQVTRVLGIPVLASVGVILTPKEIRRRRLRRLFWTPAIVVLLAALGGTATLAYASLENPALYARVVTDLNRTLVRCGLPPTTLGSADMN